MSNLTPNDIFQAIESLWAVILTIVGVIISVVTFSVRYQNNKQMVDKKLNNLEVRLLSLENQYHLITNSLVRIETILTMNQTSKDRMEIHDQLKQELSNQIIKDKFTVDDKSEV